MKTKIKLTDKWGAPQFDGNFLWTLNNPKDKGKKECLYILLQAADHCTYGVEIYPDQDYRIIMNEPVPLNDYIMILEDIQKMKESIEEDDV